MKKLLHFRINGTLSFVTKNINLQHWSSSECFLYFFFGGFAPKYQLLETLVVVARANSLSQSNSHDALRGCRFLTCPSLLSVTLFRSLNDTIVFGIRHFISYRGFRLNYLKSQFHFYLPKFIIALSDFIYCNTLFELLQFFIQVNFK